MRHLLLLLALTIPAVAYPQGVKGVEERIVELPQDAGVFHLTVFGPPTDPVTAEVEGWFNTHPGLGKIRSKTRYNVLDTTKTMYQERYKNDYAAYGFTNPQVVLQAPGGDLISIIEKSEVPITADALEKRIATDCWRWQQRRSDGRCTPPKTDPEPGPKPEPKPTPVPEPTPVPKQDPLGFDMLTVPVWILILLGAAGAGVGVFQMYNETHRGVQ